MGWSCSPAIVTPCASNASVSSVGRTEPSIAFSNGTSARSDSPEATARIASWTVAAGCAAISVPAVAARSASSEKVPAGPRKATRSGGIGRK